MHTATVKETATNFDFGHRHISKWSIGKFILIYRGYKVVTSLIKVLNQKLK